MKIHWIGHACFKVTTSTNQVIYFDPYEISQKVNDATLILCSHDHYDHADEGSIANIFNSKAMLLCPKNCVPKLKKYNARGLDPGDQLDVANIKVQAVPAYTPTKNFHPKQKKWVGFLVKVDGKVLYHAGDTDFIDEFKQLPPIDVAFLPVGGTYTMDFKEAVQAVSTIKPGITIPMHHWDKDLQEFAQMVQKATPGARVEILTSKDLVI